MNLHAINISRIAGISRHAACIILWMIHADE